MNIQFMRFRKVALMISGVLLIASVISLTFKNLELGLDFTGGVLLEIKLNENLESLEEIRTLLTEKKIEDFILNFSGSQNDVIIKIPGQIKSESSELLKSVLRENFEFDLR